MAAPMRALRPHNVEHSRQRNGSNDRDVSEGNHSALTLSAPFVAIADIESRGSDAPSGS